MFFVIMNSSRMILTYKLTIHQPSVGCLPGSAVESSGDDLSREEINFLSFLHVMRKVHHGVSHGKLMGNW